MPTKFLHKYVWVYNGHKSRNHKPQEQFKGSQHLKKSEVKPQT